MYHLRKKEDSPITAEEMANLRGPVHGRPVWKENGNGSRELYFYDSYGRAFVPAHSFTNLQERLAAERRAAYPDGRRKKSRKRREKFFFV